MKITIYVDDDNNFTNELLLTPENEEEKKALSNFYDNRDKIINTEIVKRETTWDELTQEQRDAIQEYIQKPQPWKAYVVSFSSIEEYPCELPISLVTESKN